MITPPFRSDITKQEYLNRSTIEDLRMDIKYVSDFSSDLFSPYMYFRDGEFITLDELNKELKHKQFLKKLENALK